MENTIDRADSQTEAGKEPSGLSYVRSTARIAVYDDLRSAPRVVDITSARTTDYIEALASKTYELARLAGGAIPYTVIREVSENFIHARFSEVVVSILDNGNTIRFADQGPGIPQKEKAQLPGFSSATEEMKHYIRGVGSGLPIVREYLDVSHGTISIEDNLNTGAVVTISLMRENAQKQSKTPAHAHHVARNMLIPPLSNREQQFIKLLFREGAMGITDFARTTEMANSTIHNTLKKLEEAGLVEKCPDRRRELTELGYEAAQEL